MINSKNYSNGLRLLHKQLPNVKSFTLMVYTIFGSRDEEKGEAIRHVLDLATHNGIKKDDLLKACEYLWNKVFEVENG